MILHRLWVEHWRALREGVELAELGEGLNVIHGPNETGKSTLMDAICLGFFDRHHTTGEAMQTRQPWGSSLGPTVEIEFAGGGARYRLRKRFLADAESHLWAARDGVWEKVAQGRAADEQVIELAAGDSSGRGLTKPEHWGLGQVLWARQGAAVELAVGDSQQARLRQALRLTLEGTQGEGIEQAIEQRYGAIYTATGRYRSGQQRPEVVTLAEELGQACAEEAGLEARLHAVTQNAHGLKAAEDARETMRRELAQAQAELKEKRQAMQALGERLRAYERLEAAAREAQADWERLNDQARRIREADQATEAALRAAEEIRAAMRAAERQQAQALEGRQVAQARRNAAQDALRQARRQFALAQRRQRWVQTAVEIQNLALRVQQAQAHAARLAEARRQLDLLIAPTPKQLTALRRLEEQRRQKRAALEAACLTLRIEPAQPLSFTLARDGGEPAAQSLDQPAEYRAAGSLTIDLEGVGRLVVRAGQSDAAALAEAVEGLDQQWREQTAAFPTAELAGLEELAVQRRLAEQQLAQLEEQAGGEQEVPALEQELRRLEGVRRTLLAEEPALAEADLLPEEAGRAAQAAQEACDRAAAAVEEADAALERALATHDQAQAALDQHRRALAAAEATHKAQSRQADLLRAEAGRDDEQRQADLRAALLAKDAAQQRLAAAERPPVAVLEADSERLERAVEALRLEELAQAERIGQLQNELERSGGEGLYDQWVRAAERCEQLRRRLARAELEAHAVRLLRDTLRQQKQAVFEAMLRPVRQMVTGTLEQIAGPRYTGVEFDQRLTPTGVRPAARGNHAAVEDLSHGTREQLMLAVRLALARLLSREGQRQCVILDDPLVNADRARQRAALRILEEAAQEAQILIFTCHPAAYQGLGAARMFDLERLRTAAQSAAPAAL